MGIITYLQNSSLKSEDRRLQRQKKIKNLSEINTVFAVVSIKSLEEYERWQLIFKNLSKNTMVFDWIAFMPTTKKTDFTKIPENVFTTKDVNFLGFPRKSQFIKGKYTKSYDLTIDLNFDNVYLLNWIWVLINSHLRVGSDFKQNMQDYYDFTMSTKDPSKQSKLFLDQVFYFLDNINK